MMHGGEQCGPNRFSAHKARQYQARVIPAMLGTGMEAQKNAVQEKQTKGLTHVRYMVCTPESYFLPSQRFLSLI